MTSQLKANKTVPRQRALPVYVSIGEAAEAMSVSTKTIRRRINDGAIPAYRFGRRTSGYAWRTSRRSPIECLR